MNLPILIFAEAAVKSKRADYKSILDPDPQLNTVGFKTFYSDPDLIAEAVTKFKQAGFSLTSVNRTGVGIMGTVARFERTFKVKLVGKEIRKASSGKPLISVTCDRSDRLGYIDTSKIADFANILAGISISQPVAYANPVPAMPDDSYKTGNRLRLADLWEQLNGNQIIGGSLEAKEIDRALYNGEGVEVIIVDSGCYKEHPFFKAMGVSDSIKVEPNLATMSDQVEKKLKTLRNELIDKKNELAKLQTEQTSSLNNEKNNPKTKEPAAADDDDFDSLLGDIQEASKDEKLQKTQQLIDEITKEVKEAATYDKRSRDFDGHGTAMVASVLAIAPKAIIKVFKVMANIINESFWQELLSRVKSSPDTLKIISCSFGHQSLSYRQVHRGIEEIAQHAILLFPTGNFTGSPDDRADDEALSCGVFAIGGAYREKDKLFASDVAYAEISPTISSDKTLNGTKRRIPDICGWCGPNADKRLILPVDPFSDSNGAGGMPNEWQLTNGGTSSATAQVAGVIALIKQVWPGATREEILATLTTTADEIGRGTFANKVKPYDLGTVGYGIGIANIAKIIATARKAAASKQATSELKQNYVNALLKIFKERQSKINAFIKQY